MNNLAESINQVNEQLGKYTTFQIPYDSWMPAVMIAITIVIGVIYCFFGYKAVRVLSAIIGAFIGILVGMAVAGAARFEAPLTFIIPAIGALIFGFLGFLLYRIGVFLVILLAAFAITAALVFSYTKLDQTVVVIVSLVVGVILAVLAVVYLRPIVIIATALSGGLTISNEIFANLIKVRWSSQVETITRLSVGLLLALIGMLYQFKTTKKKEDIS